MFLDNNHLSVCVEFESRTRGLCMSNNNENEMQLSTHVSMLSRVTIFITLVGVYLYVYTTPNSTFLFMNMIFYYDNDHVAYKSIQVSIMLTRVITYVCVPIHSSYLSKSEFFFTFVIYI